MKKIILPLLLCFGLAVNAQTNFYIKAKWTNETFDAVETYTANLLGPGYILGAMQKRILDGDGNDQASFHFVNYSTKKLMWLQLVRAYINADKDMGVKGDAIINEIYLTGFFPDVLQIYKTAFGLTPNIDALKQSGDSGSVTKAGSTEDIVITLRRQRFEDGQWVLHAVRVEHPLKTSPAGKKRSSH